MEHKVTINGVELCYSIFNADFMKRFQQCLSSIKSEIADSSQTDDVHDAIVSQCRAVYSFFEGLFGSERANAIFGQELDLMVYLKSFESFVKSVNDQLSMLDDLSQKYSPCSYA